jgi:predicted nucleotidyltransferase
MKPLDVGCNDEGSPMETSDRIVAALQAHEPELRAAGIRALSIFGSVARGEEHADSDVDVVVRLDPDAHVGLVRFVALERRLTELLGRTVQMLPEPVDSPRLRAHLERGRQRVF